MKIAISAESTIDLTKELLKEFDIHTIPFTFELQVDRRQFSIHRKIQKDSLRKTGAGVQPVPERLSSYSLFLTFFIVSSNFSITPCISFPVSS